jgi:hypothetical protein
MIDNLKKKSGGESSRETRNKWVREQVEKGYEAITRCGYNEV